MDSVWFARNRVVRKGEVPNAEVLARDTLRRNKEGSLSEAWAGKCVGSNPLQGECMAALMALQMAKEWAKECIMEGDSQMLYNHCTDTSYAPSPEIVEEVYVNPKIKAT
ncbi:hypothetical protein CJ030_MR3G009352 [Morella rubra]|uniref:Uncharacterized protein n=1 Tax=Morella rubra TaxID=262757 RepID=A0A6A1WAH7_9ROSI|nr:hypothetical protein CJ030_MR3G009352 [Morella rubra]